MEEMLDVTASASIKAGRNGVAQNPAISLASTYAGRRGRGRVRR